LLPEIGVEELRAVGAAFLAEVHQQALAAGGRLGDILAQIEKRILEPARNLELAGAAQFGLLRGRRAGGRETEKCP
jgi:hypothetical protein